MSIIFMPFVLTVNCMVRFSDGMKYLFFCRLGRKRRFVALRACDRVFPVWGFFPVITQTLDIIVAL